VPSDPIARALITEFEKISNSAIAAPSANRFGQVSPTSSADVEDELGEYLDSVDLILDGGDSTIGIESTIIDCTREHPVVLRSGAVTKRDIELELDIFLIDYQSPAEVRFSGSFDKHYAPKCRVLIGEIQMEGEGFLALSEIETPSGMVRLAKPATLEEFARILYATFRAADYNGQKVLVVSPPSGEGIAKAIRERITKASAGRR
jgi:L-threonylcarbamoyladenylate synthase